MEVPARSALLRRWRLELSDRARHHPLARDLMARGILARTPRSPADRDSSLAALERICSAARLAPDERRMMACEDRLRPLAERLAATWPEVLTDGRDDRVLTRAVILKAPAPGGERGALYISFESCAEQLLLAREPAGLAERYDIIVAPSWSPPHNRFCWLFPRLWPRPVYCQISNLADLETLPRIAAGFVPVPLFASSWVDPARFQPLPPAERDIDLLMVANFGTFKRHWVLFAAMRKMPVPPRVTIIGQEQDGRTAEAIRLEARLYGVEQYVTVLSDQPYTAVAATMVRAKASVVLSKREGSCVVVAESLFADVPAAVLRGAGIGSAAFLNEATGRLLDEQCLASDLARFLRDAESFEPRRWALEHTGYERSSRELNELLRERAAAEGRPWTQDLAPMVWAPDPVLATEADRRRLASAREALLAEHGLDVGGAARYEVTN